FEAEVADTTSPRGNDPTDRPEVRTVGMLLVEVANDVRRDADEGTKCRCRLDAVLPAVPGSPEHHRHLLEVVHIEAPGIVAELGATPTGTEGIRAEQAFEFLRKRRLRHPAVPYAQQLDLAPERRLLAFAER